MSEKIGQAIKGPSNPPQGNTTTKKKRPYRRKNKNHNKAKPAAVGIVPDADPSQASENQPLNTNNSDKKKSEEESSQKAPLTEKTVKKEVLVKKTVKEKVVLNDKPVKVDLVMKPAEVIPSPINAPSAKPTEKSREQVMAEREAKKLAKQVKKAKTEGEGKVPDNISKETPKPNPSKKVSPKAKAPSPSVDKEKVLEPATTNEVLTEKSRDQVKAEREAKKHAKQAKQAAKAAKTLAAPTAPPTVESVTEDLKKLDVNSTSNQTHHQVPEKKKPEQSKAERRAMQEAQRAAKAQATHQKTNGTSKTTSTYKAAVSKKTDTHAVSRKSSESKTVSSQKSKECRVKLFNHLESSRTDVNLFVNNTMIHPSIARLGEQYAKRTVVGSNARCIAFLNALKMVIQDFETPPKKEFSRSLEVTIKHCVEHLQKCRPLAVSVNNAHKHIKHVLTQLPVDQPESDLKQSLCHFIETYIENQIGKAAEAISSSLQEKISDGDVILTFGCSSLIHFVCEEAHKRKVDFRVIIVDSRPFCEGQELLRRLSAKGIPCTYVLINAVGFVMPEATKVLLGAHALLSNGNVMARTGTAQVALVARSYNVPVLVCCETHKFSERFQTDAIVYNELGNPDDLVLSDKCCLTNWKTKGAMAPLNLNYDITPPELVTAVVTEVSILPCTSVPVILRIKPTEIGY